MPKNINKNMATASTKLPIIRYLILSASVLLNLPLNIGRRAGKSRKNFYVAHALEPQGFTRKDRNGIAESSK